jgi:hypothetical protein
VGSLFGLFEQMCHKNNWKKMNMEWVVNKIKDLSLFLLEMTMM